MTTYMNQIVQLTRRMNAIEADGYDARTGGAEYADLMARRADLIVKAIEVGLSAEMIAGVIRMNSDTMAVQLMRSAAHLASASVS